MWYYFRMGKPKGLKEKYRAVRGQSLTIRDIKEWSEEQHLEFIRLIHFFTVDGSITFTDVGVKSFQQHALERPFWEQLLWRWELNGDDYDLKAFRSRLFSTITRIGKYLQENSFIITPEMRGMMKANKYLEKYTEPFVVKELEGGGELVVPNDDNGLNKFSMPEVQYNKALLKMASVANNLLEGIKLDDLKKMPVKERIELANKLVVTMSRLQGGHKPNVAIMKNLIINQAGRSDLEAAMMNFAKEG